MNRERFLHLIPLSAATVAYLFGDKVPYRRSVKLPDYAIELRELKYNIFGNEMLKAFCRSLPDEFVTPPTGKLVWPVLGRGTLTSYFSQWHPGIDYAALEGTPVVAVDGGESIAEVNPDLTFGKHLMVDHGRGKMSLYAHLSVIYPSDRKRIARGEVIGRVGNTGNSTGPHLHFEIIERRVDGCWAVNPLLYLPTSRLRNVRLEPLIAPGT